MKGKVQTAKFSATDITMISYHSYCSLLKPTNLFCLYCCSLISKLFIQLILWTKSILLLVLRKTSVWYVRPIKHKIVEVFMYRQLTAISIDLFPFPLLNWFLCAFRIGMLDKFNHHEPWLVLLKLFWFIDLGLNELNSFRWTYWLTY